MIFRPRVFLFAAALTTLPPSVGLAGQVIYAAEDDRGINVVNPLTGSEGHGCFVSGGGAVELVAMTVDPSTGDLYVGVDTTGSDTHSIWQVDVRTCLANDIGDTGDLITGLAFDGAGTLYAVTSDDVGGNTTDTLLTVDMSTGALTFFMALPGPDGFGDTIAFNPSDGFMYHLTGEYLNGSTAFNKINLASKSSTALPLSGDRPSGSQVTSFVWDPSTNQFIGYREGIGVDGEYFSLTTAGVQSKLSDQQSTYGGRTMVGMGIHDTNVYPSPAATTSGMNVYTVDAFGPYVSQINPATGEEVGVQAVNIPGQTLFGFNGLAYDPTTGDMFAIGRLAGGGVPRSIVKIDPETGVGELIGNTGERVASLAVDDAGILYASTSSNAIDPANDQSLFTVNKTTGELTLHTVMGGLNNEAEALAFNSSDGLMYRASGRVSFEKYDLSTGTPTVVPYSGDMQISGSHYVYALSYDAAQDLFLGWKVVDGNVTFRYFTLTPAGFMTDLFTSYHHKKGIAISGGRLSTIVDGDQDGDGKSDILFRNNVNGSNQLYVMNGNSIEQNLPMTPVAASWQAVGRGDYNGDGKSDVLWRYTPTGALWIYFMNANFATSSKFVATVSDANWKIVGNGDYNGDGKSDILFRHQVLGTVWLYTMDANIIANSTGVGVVPDLNWQIVGSGDYNGDGKSDVLWRNSATGTNWMYLMNGAAIITSVGISVTPDLGWQIVGNGDYNGDGRGDILWRNSSSGTNWVYLMNGTAIQTSSSISVLPDLAWKIVGDGDYNGDGNADVLWRNMSNGANRMYLMDGVSILSNAPVSTVTDQNWQVVDPN